MRCNPRNRRKNKKTRKRRRRREKKGEKGREVVCNSLLTYQLFQHANPSFRAFIFYLVTNFYLTSERFATLPVLSAFIAANSRALYNPPFSPFLPRKETIEQPTIDPRHLPSLLPLLADFSSRFFPPLPDFFVPNEPPQLHALRYLNLV